MMFLWWAAAASLERERGVGQESGRYAPVGEAKAGHLLHSDRGLDARLTQRQHAALIKMLRHIGKCSALT